MVRAVEKREEHLLFHFPEMSLALHVPRTVSYETLSLSQQSEEPGRSRQAQCPGTASQSLHLSSGEGDPHP